MKSADTAPLTERQHAVMRLLADGHSGTEIADRLGVGYETVRTHIKDSRERLGARTQAHAVALWITRQSDNARQA